MASATSTIVKMRRGAFMFEDVSPSPGQRRPTDDSLSLPNSEHMIGRQILDDFGRAVGPADLETLCPIRRAQSEVRAQIVLSEIAGSGLYLANLAASAGRERQPRADAAAVARRAD